MSKQVKILLAVLLVAAAACCAALLMPKEGGAIARVTFNGNVLSEIDLSAVEAPSSFIVTGEAGSNTIQVEQGRIRVAEADCPDQVCVNQGWISDSALPIVCLPNKLVIEIIGGEGALDAAVK